MFFRRFLRPTPPIPLGENETDNNNNARDEQAIDVLARTIWGEARGEPLLGKEAVASVVLNRREVARARGRFWWGDDIVEICHKPYQFSCWNEDDPNRALLLRVTDADPNFALCQRIARRAVRGLLSDSTNGATHYHATYVLPNWAEGRAPTTEIGAHIFYRVLD